MAFCLHKSLHVKVCFSIMDTKDYSLITFFTLQTKANDRKNKMFII